MSNDPETYAIIGASMEAHRVLGHGFLEAVYQEALEHEFRLRNIPFSREQKINIQYKGCLLKKHYEADFICYDAIVLEIKAQDCLTGADEGQLINYLKATALKRGLLINFGAPSLEYRRMVLNL